MRLGVFVSDYRLNVDTLDRLKSEQAGIILVENGVYHAAVKDAGKASPVLEKSPKIYALKDDLETRGLSAAAVDPRVKVVTYGDVVDLMFNEYEKFAWL